MIDGSFTLVDSDSQVPTQTPCIFTVSEQSNTPTQFCTSHLVLGIGLSNT